MKLLVVALGLVGLTLLAGVGRAAPDSHSIASFFTPQKAAYCKFYVPLEQTEPATHAETTLECWTPNDGFTVWMKPRTKPKRRYYADNKWRYARSVRVLSFGQTWWGSENGLTADEVGNAYTEFSEGTGSPKGTLLYRCRSRSNGLTCTNRAGHGWWLGRFKGYRIF